MELLLSAAQIILALARLVPWILPVVAWVSKALYTPIPVIK